MQPIPLSHPDITQREIDAVVDVLHTPTLSIGPRVEQFRRKSRGRYGPPARRCGVQRHLRAARGDAGRGVGPGDEVLTTPFSFVASANCILYVGATPVFVDIESKTMNVDVEKMAAAITPRTNPRDRRCRSVRPSRRDDRARTARAEK